MRTRAQRGNGDASPKDSSPELTAPLCRKAKSIVFEKQVKDCTTVTVLSNFGACGAVVLGIKMKQACKTLVRFQRTSPRYPILNSFPVTPLLRIDSAFDATTLV